jgi:hypothetical protein
MAPRASAPAFWWCTFLGDLHRGEWSIKRDRHLRESLRVGAVSLRPTLRISQRHLPGSHTFTAGRGQRGAARAQCTRARSACILAGREQVPGAMGVRMRDQSLAQMVAVTTRDANGIANFRSARSQRHVGVSGDDSARLHHHDRPRKRGGFLGRIPLHEDQIGGRPGGDPPQPGQPQVVRCSRRG